MQEKYFGSKGQDHSENHLIKAFVATYRIKGHCRMYQKAVIRLHRWACWSGPRCLHFVIWSFVLHTNCDKDKWLFLFSTKKLIIICTHNIWFHGEKRKIHLYWFEYPLSRSTICFRCGSQILTNHNNCRLLYRLLVILKVIFANSVDPDQTAPLGSGYTLFACMQK